MNDRTARLARRLRSRLEPGEQVLAAVAMNARGTMGAALSGAARAADGVASVGGDDGGVSARHAALGIRGVRFYLVLTDARLVLVRRNLFGIAAEVTFAVPVEQVERLRITRQTLSVPVRLTDGRVIDLETPKAGKHLPAVYLELSDRLAAARAARTR